jgi:hypothetical protein
MSSFTPPERSDPLQPAGPNVGLIAGLTIRFGQTRLPGRLFWPPVSAAGARLPLIVLVVEPEDASGAHVFSGMLSSASPAVVLLITPLAATRHIAGSIENTELAALGWMAEHASELGANPRGLSVGGLYGGGGRAAWLAIHARDNAWPLLRRQLLAHPEFTAPFPIPPDVTGVVPATIVTTPGAEADGTRYAARLRAAGTDVEEFCRHDYRLPQGRQLGELVRSLRTGFREHRGFRRMNPDEGRHR